MSAAERQNGAGPRTESVDLAALRVSLRCGRSLPVRHLVESGEAFMQRHHIREVIVLCCADVAESDPDVEDPDYLDCPGCPGCLRYCPDCARTAHRFSAELPDPMSAAPGGGPDHAP